MVKVVLTLKRPMMVIGITYLLSQLAAIAIGSTLSTFFCVTVAAFSVAGFFLLSDKHRRLILPVLVSCAVALGSYAVYYHVKVEPAQRLFGQTVFIRGQITQEPYTSNGRTYYVVDTDYIESRQKIQQACIRISAQTPLEAEITDIFEGEVIINIPDDEEAFSAATSRIAKGIILTGYIPYGTEPTITEGKHGINYLISRMRYAISTKVHQLFDKELSSLLKGVLLGDKGEMSNKLKSNFRICGLSHLLAVSGLHMSILVYVLTLLLRQLGISYRPLAAILIGFIIFYMALTGFSYSVLRAGIMTGMMLLARVLNRQADSLSSFGTALLLICLFNPYAAADAGLLLSASSAFGLIAVNGRVLRQVKVILNEMNIRSGIVHGAVSSVVTSIVATLFATPIIMLYFGEYSLISPLANLLCIQVANIFLLSGALAVLLSFIPLVGGFAAYIAAAPAWIAGKLLIFITGVLGGLPNASIPVNYAFLPVFFICAAIIIIVWIFISRGSENRLKSFCCCLGVLLFVFLCGLTTEYITRANENYVTIYSVENGVAVAAVSGYNCIVVGTGGDKYDAWKMTEDLQEQNLTKIDALFYPDSSKTYASYAEEFLELYNVKSVFLPASLDDGDDLAYAVRNVSDRLYDISFASCSFRKGKLSAETFTDADGLMWVYIVDGSMSILVCPENGNFNKLPDYMRYPWCAVVTTSDMINVGALSAGVIVVSADRDGCAEAAAILRYRGAEKVYTTADGNITIYDDETRMLIGG